MAWFFKKNNEVKQEKNISKINSFLTTSFSHVKSDIQNLVEWLRFFNQKHDEHDQKFEKTDHRLRHIEQQLAYLPHIYAQLQNTQNQPKNQILLQRVRNLHDKISMMDHDHAPILRRLQEIEQAILAPKTGNLPVVTKLNEVASRLEILENQPKSASKTTVKDRMFTNITRNSKEYVKKLILGLISKYESISATQLKQIIVDEQGLCSKSTFYRVLREAEEQDFIDVITQGKEKKYIAKQLMHV